MENWQLTLVVVASVLAGAAIPLLALMAIALYRAGKEMAEISGRLKRTLDQVEVISDRVEVLSRGLKGGEQTIAEVLAAVSHLASGLERNLKTINLVSTIVASVGTAVATFVSARYPSEAAARPDAPAGVEIPGNGTPPATALPHDD